MRILQANGVYLVTGIGDKKSMKKMVSQDLLEEQFGGDRDLFVQVVNSFLKHCPDRMESIGKAISEKNAKNLEIHAHGIKGSLRNFCVDGPCKTAQTLELMGRTADFSSTQGPFRQLNDEINQVCQELRTILNN